MTLLDQEEVGGSSSLGTLLMHAVQGAQGGGCDEDTRNQRYEEALHAASFLLQRRHAREVASIVSGWFEQQSSTFCPRTLLRKVWQIAGHFQCVVSEREKESVEYLVGVLKKVFKVYDRHGLAWDEDLVSVYQDLTSQLHEMSSGGGAGEEGSTEKGWVHRTYVYARPPSRLDTGQVVLRSCRNMLEGNTGCHAWEAAFALFEFILGNPQEFRGKRVVELGSGCGLLGKALRAPPGGASPYYGKGEGGEGEADLAKEVFLTDSSEQALLNLSHNLRMNGLRPRRVISASEPAEDEGEQEEGFTEGLFVSHLDWSSVVAETETETETPSPSPLDVDSGLDVVVLGSDITYDDTIIPDLCQVILLLLSRSRDQGKAKAYISAMPRNPATLKLFESTVKDLGMSIDLVDLDLDLDLDVDDGDALRLEQQKQQAFVQKQPLFRFVSSELQQQARKSVKMYVIRLVSSH